MKELNDLSSRRTSLALCAILIFGTALRLFHINYQSLWYDELHSIIPTSPSNSLGSIIEYAKNDQPPFFFIYVHYAFKLFGYSELVGRVASACIGVVGIVAIYFLGKEILDKGTGLFAALLTAVNYYHIYYSQELRFYSMCFLLSALSYLFFIRAFKESKPINFLAYVLSTVCLLYTHFYGLVIFCTQALTFVFLLIYKRDSKFVIGAVLSGFVITLSFIPWIPVVIGEAGIESFWIKPPSPFFVAIYFYDYTGKDIFTALLFVFFLFLFVRSLRKNKLINKDNGIVDLILILWFVFSYLLPYIRSIISAPMLHDRYTIVTLPALIIMVAIGWNTIKNNSWKYGLALILVLSSLLNLIFFKQHYTRIEKSQFREVSEIVKSSNPRHYPIYSRMPWHFNYYFRNVPDKVSDIAVSDLSQVENLWLLQAHFTQDEMEAELNTLRKTFVVVEEHPQFEANAVLLKRK